MIKLRKMPEEVQKEVLELWLEGNNYKDISSRSDVSTGAINSILDMHACKIRKQGSSLHDVLRGSLLLDKLNQLGISLGELDGLLKILTEVAAERQIGEEELVNASLKLRRLEVESNKSFKEVIKDFNEKQTLIKHLEMRATKIREKIQRLNTEKGDLKDTLNKVREELILTVETKKRLSKLSLQELDKLAKHVEKETLLDNKIIERQNELESLRRKIDFLRKYVADIRRIDRIIEMQSINIMCPYCGCLTWKTLNRWECENLLWSKIPPIVKCVHCGSTTQYDLVQMLVALSLEILS